MPAKEKEDKTFKLSELPDYDYKSGLACPECYAPIARGRVDGRCDDCQKSKLVLPVNRSFLPFDLSPKADEGAGSASS